MDASDLQVADNSRWPIFLPRRSEPSEALHAVLRSSILFETLARLVRDEWESMHIVTNRITLYARSLPSDDILAAVDKLSDLMNLCESLGTADIADYSDLPIEFHDLIPLIRRWAASDDEARTMLLDEASDYDLHTLVETVGPRLDEINRYLSDFKELPLSESATALGALAEGTAEAQLLLKQSSPEG